MRWLPHPLMTLTLAAVWLLLVNTFDWGQLLLGLALGVLIPRFTDAFWPERPRMKRPGLMLRYLARLLADIVVANFEVARRILGPTAKLRPAFIELEVTLRDEFAVTLLASTISLTPGTVSADLSRDRRTLLIHCLDVPDPEALCHQIRQRYEEPLREIFE